MFRLICVHSLFHVNTYKIAKENINVINVIMKFVTSCFVYTRLASYNDIVFKQTAYTHQRKWNNSVAMLNRLNTQKYYYCVCTGVCIEYRLKCFIGIILVYYPLYIIQYFNPIYEKCLFLQIITMIHFEITNTI